MFVKQFEMGGERNFGYLIADQRTRKAVVVDPSFEPERVVAFAREKGYKIIYVLVTHDHPDHTNGNAAIERLTGVRPLLYGDTDRQTSVRVEDGASFHVGDLTVRIIHTPGHTKDSICIQVGDALFTGDTLFVGKVGGTGCDSEARAEYDSLHEKILALPDRTRVFPGHNYGTALESTIGVERETNPFLVQPDFAAFVALKRNWLAYKEEHGIV
ncbi:MBL fold metallo-hydrolase [Candidatus Bipolaricaulota bacterium]|nr:MBL fold metallo-hydrolase [Candidatus Bipolaricaulota bacterium]